MLSTFGKIIWTASKVIAVLFGVVILASATSEGRLFEAGTFLAIIIWSGGVLLVGRFLYGVLR
jgi:hypothetical protein